MRACVDREVTFMIRLAICLAVLQFSFLQAAGFDCTKARSTNEKLICGDKELSALDDVLETLYTEARETVFDKKGLGVQKANEWKWREKNCDDKPCLLQWYARCTAQLRELIAVERQVAPVTPDHDAAIPRSDDDLSIFFVVGAIALSVLPAVFLIVRRCRRKVTRYS